MRSDGRTRNSRNIVQIQIYIYIALTSSLNSMCVLSVQQANVTRRPPFSQVLFFVCTLISSGSDYDNDNGNVYVLYNVILDDVFSCSIIDTIHKHTQKNKDILRRKISCNFITSLLFEFISTFQLDADEQISFN